MRILVLGDSSSAGIGSQQQVFPALLQHHLGDGHRIENHAVTGFTSADAARYYLRTQAAAAWDVLIVCLGNNDGARSRYKGTYHAWRDLGRTSDAKADVRRLRPVQLHRFNSNERPASVATNPRDFQRNLRTIVRAAGKRHTRVILINPVANSAYPAAMMAPNAPFFRIVGLETRVVRRLTGDSMASHALIEAIALHERAELDAAAVGYRSLTQEGGPVGSVALNNLAVLLDEQDCDTEAAAILQQLADTDGPAAAVASYNLGRIFARRGRADLAREWLARAADRDTYLYRVKTAYRAELAALSTETEVLDLAGVLEPADFVDYCHPTAAGHSVIAAALAARLAGVGVTANREPDAAYVCVQPNPDAVADYRSDLLDRYGIDTGADRAAIAQACRALLSRASERHGDDPSLDQIQWPQPESSLQADILATFQHASEHPIVTTLADLANYPPDRGCEIGSFPEFYLCRLLRDYGAFAEQMGIDELPDDAHGWQLGPQIQQQRILSHDPPEPPGQPQLEAEYGARVLRRVCEQLAQGGDLFEDVRGSRVLTVRWWYSREAFRYGTHSRISMLYPLWEMEKLAEGLYVCLIIARHGRDDVAERLVALLLARLTVLREVHERYAKQFQADGLCGDGDEYRAELAAVRDLFTADLNITGGDLR